LPPLDSSIKKPCPQIASPATASWDDFAQAWQDFTLQYVACAKRGDKAVKIYEDAAKQLESKP